MQLPEYDDSNLTPEQRERGRQRRAALARLERAEDRVKMISEVQALEGDPVPELMTSDEIWKSAQNSLELLATINDAEREHTAAAAEFKRLMIDEP